MENSEQWIRSIYSDYDVSSMGRVRTFKRGKILKHGLNYGSRGRGPNSAYHFHILRDSGGNKRWVSVHRLVLLSFVGYDPVRNQVNHKNGIKADNRLENLEWVTNVENTAHWMASLGGAEKRKRKKKHAPLSVRIEQYVKAVWMKRRGKKNHVIAAKIGLVSTKAIHQLLKTGAKKGWGGPDCVYMGSVRK